MWFLSKFFENRSLDESVSSFLRGEDILSGAVSSSGAVVSEESSLKVTTVYSCVKIIAWTIASLPIPLYSRLANGGRERVYSDTIYKLLNVAPNSEQTPFEFKSLLSVHQNLWGAGVAEIEFNAAGQPVGLWPLAPWLVTPKRTSTNDLYYELRDPKTSETTPIPKENIICFRTMSTTMDGWKSPVAIHRDTIGLAMALKDFGSKTFSQGTNPAAILTHPGKLTPNAEVKLRESLAGYTGLSNSHRLMLLEDGIKFDRIGLPPEDAQYLESQKFSVADIARIYNVPLYLLQDHEKSTSWGSGIEEMNLGFISYTLRPYLVQWEEELTRKLIFNDTYFIEFLIDALLRGRLSERYEAYVKARNGGWMSVNDIRRLENMNPIGEEGDIYLSPLNMESAKFAGEDKAKKEGGTV